MNFYYIYILHNSSKNFIYVGYSEDLKSRVESHNKGENKSTKAYVPLELIHYEAYINMKDAKRRETYLKTNHGRTTLLTMLKEYFDETARPPTAKTCPVCGGKGEATNDTFFKYGQHMSRKATICLTCRGQGWIDSAKVT